MPTTFRFVALPREPFLPLFALTDADLAARGARRMTADTKPGYPCRVSLADAEPGERVLLLTFTHQPAATPYRAAGPIFVREAAEAARPEAGEVPDVVRPRLLSVRAYDAADGMVAAEVGEGRAVEALIARCFGQADVAYLHLHNAKPGCLRAAWTGRDRLRGGQRGAGGRVAEF